MGLFTDVNQNQEVNIEKSPVVVKTTKNGGIIVCPICDGSGEYWHPDYGYTTGDKCDRCKGGGAIEVKVIR